MPSTICHIKNFNEKKNHLDLFDPKTETWVVPDLQSKIELQNHLLKKYGHLEEDSVLRANELWQKLAWRYKPQWKILDSDLIRVRIEQELNHSQYAWARGPSVAHNLMQLMPQLIPLLTQIPSTELVEDWFRQNLESFSKWGHWFRLAEKIWQFLDHQKITTSAWIIGLLQENSSEYTWNKNLKFDLGVKMSGLELKTIETLAKYKNVQILIPTPSWAGAFSEVLSPYQKISKKTQPKITLAQLKSQVQPEVRHFSTLLSEIKDAVATVRKWLEQGNNINNICILCPEIEPIWSLLSAHLKQEGIPTQKKTTISYHSLPQVQTCLAKMRLQLGELSTSDLETTLFNQSHPQISHNTFSQLFSNFHDTSQLNWLYKENNVSQQDRNQEHILAQINSENLTFDQYIEWFVSSWNSFPQWAEEKEMQLLTDVVRKMAQAAAVPILMPSKHWVQWTESFLGKMEISLEEDFQTGIFCGNISTAEYLEMDFVYFLGLNGERKTYPNGISSKEISTLEQDLGVQIPYLENDTFSFDLRWLLDKNCKEFILSSSSCDLKGNPNSIEKIWAIHSQQLKQDLTQPKAPQATRWDEIQQLPPQTLTNLRSWPKERENLFIESMEQDLGIKPLLAFAQNKITKFSPSSLERYAQCPFIFAAEKVFNLKDSPPLDFDLDPMSRGQITHKIFETLTKEPFQGDLSTDEISSIVQQKRNELSLPEHDLWFYFSKKFVEQVQNFIQAEKQWRKKFPNTKTVARELKFSVPWKNFMSQDLNSSNYIWEINGFIDRIDTNGSGDYVVLDYKSSTSSLVQAASWNTNNHFQLALYAQAVEHGWTSLPKGNVVGAFYYDTKNMNRDKGLRISVDTDLLPEEFKKIKINKFYSEEEKIQLWKEINSNIHQIMHNIDQGFFSPNPKNMEDCSKCPWQKNCRAPHLN
ncbi:MAG: PD-(D/E)XK nuclease family protein [Bdellovibrionales bacterium]|nr:PD-(D/E)XK nuclease family protein [Bdellovibrionales bacterium]